MHRDTYISGQAPDWSREAQAFKPLTERIDADGNVVSGLYYRAADQADLADDDVELQAYPGEWQYQRGLRHGWIGAGAFYALGSVVLILAFRWLGA